MKKIIIADSGSTKTDWVIVDLLSGNELHRFSTSGINPFYMQREEITSLVRRQWDKDIGFNDVERVHFYGAGCSSESKCQIVQSGLKGVFPDSDIRVSHDMMAAARAFPGNESRIACILGTGSNACLYADGEIREKVFSLGYLFGDEGSGAHIGKKMAASYLKEEMPKPLARLLEEKYAESKEEILHQVYGKPFPNRYLAGFAKLAGENLEHPFIQQVVDQCFYSFFQNYVLTFSDALQHPVFFTGSVAHHFQPLLENVAGACGYPSIVVCRSPLQGLIDYHVKRD